MPYEFARYKSNLGTHLAFLNIYEKESEYKIVSQNTPMGHYRGCSDSVADLYLYDIGEHQSTKRKYHQALGGKGGCAHKIF